MPPLQLEQEQQGRLHMPLQETGDSPGSGQQWPATKPKVTVIKILMLAEALESVVAGH